MNKLTLNLEALDVQSFEVAEVQAAGIDGSVTVTLADCCITFTCGDSHIRACMEA
jgi:hypothetical protein